MADTQGLGPCAARREGSSPSPPTMEYKYFSKNGKILPIEEAVIPLSSIEYQYGFGVYETIRVTNGVSRFLSEHLERLAESARIIGLEHLFSTTTIYGSVEKLIEKNNVETCNLKILLIGGKTKEDASLYILALSPLFPDKKLYRDGVHCITYPYERVLPHAKTLNMLGSYLAYRKARMADAYDALLLNRKGSITEGTRTNFFCIKDKTIMSPPEEEILLGVTRKHVLSVARENGFSLEERDITFEELRAFDGAFITSTSSKVMPIRTIDSFTFKEPGEALKELMRKFDDFLSSVGEQSRVT